MTVAIKFCGAARNVTGSVHQISTNKSNVILDCGLFHGPRDEYYRVNSSFSFNPQNLDACILSHAHIDHCGNIPTLIKKGFRAHIYCTPTTRDLCHYMLPDSGFVQEEDIKYVNKVNKRRGLPPRTPLYTKKEAERALRYFRTLDYHHTLALTKDVSLTFYQAGHILGSAVTVLDLADQNSLMRIAYAVDLGRTGMPLLRNPEVPEDIDYLIIESTYGARKHEDIREAELKLAQTINKTVRRGGKIIIPSFALERTQLIVFFISELIKRKMIKKLPIYVDGPLAVNLTKVFRANARDFDQITQAAFLREEDPLGYDNITYVHDVQQSKKLNDISKPVIIISASGMCENGRILHHLKNNIENPKNTIVVIGYMAKDTLGRRIVEKNKTVRIFGRPYELRSEVVVINAFSSHADKDGLLDYCRKSKNGLKQIFIVHGELTQAEAFRDNIARRLNIKARIPAKDEIVYLKARKID
ncbi:MAG: MBL fold metallo-hydrolase [Candidatus Omnitrophica bacterium]|nr:MBL fold metallo-hydrolase [Candidatus Omnitrophota bacterium]